MPFIYYIITFIGGLALLATGLEEGGDWFSKVAGYLMGGLIVAIGQAGLWLRSNEMGGGPFALVGLVLTALGILSVGAMVLDYAELDQETLWAGVLLTILLLLSGIALIRFDHGRHLARQKKKRECQQE